MKNHASNHEATNSHVIDGSEVKLFFRHGLSKDIDLYRLIDQLDVPDRSAEEVLDIIKQLSGQFSFVVLYVSSGVCYLVTDPIGAEPVYYLDNGLQQNWGFRIKDLTRHLDVKKLNFPALDESMLYRWLNEDNTMMAGIKRVNPGQMVEISKNGSTRILNYPTPRYQAANLYCSMTENDAIEQTNKALEIYFLRLRRNSPRIAVLLSGGVDSSLLLAKAREFDFEKLIAITCEFKGAENPELKRAQSVSRQLGVDLEIVTIDDDYIISSIPKIVYLLESPNAYFNCIARLKMMESLQGRVDAIVIGEGADGMFSMEVGGGSRALKFERKRKVVKIIPEIFRNNIAKILEKTHRPRVARLHKLLTTDSINYLRTQGEAFPDFAPAISFNCIHITDLMPVLKKIRSNRKSYPYSQFEPKTSTEISENFVIDFCQNRGLYTQNRHQYLCYLVICHEFGLNLAAPFLSKEIMDIGLNLPLGLRSDSRGAKPVLKKLACRYISEDIIYAPKLGFETPLSEWLIRCKSDWMKWLKSDLSKNRGIIDFNIVDKLNPERDALVILSAVMLEFFCQQFIDS